MSRRGYSLIELLVVIAVIAVLIGVLLPALGTARDASRTALCLSNLRQMGQAMSVYSLDSDEHVPASLYIDLTGATPRTIGWDFRYSPIAGGQRAVPGALWGTTRAGDVMSCPAFEGSANWEVLGSEPDPHTGYNYNTSYLGGPTQMIVGPDGRVTMDGASQEPVSIEGRRLRWTARTGQVQDASATVAFGDGSFGGGANKFMRSPWRGTRDSDISPATSAGGAQGFIHNDWSNAAFVDGHAAPFGTRFAETDGSGVGLLRPQSGFLSPDNSVYDLRVGPGADGGSPGGA